MVAPVIGRSVPLMAPADSAGSGGSGQSPLDKAKELMKLQKKIKDDLNGVKYEELPDADAETAAKAFLKSKKNKKALDPLLGAARDKAAAINAKNDIKDLKDRTFQANIEGRHTLGGDKELQFLKAEAELGDVNLFGSKTTYLGFGAKLNADTGYEDAKGLGLPSGRAPVGSLLQATDASKWFGSASLRLVHKSDDDSNEGHSVSTGLGFTDNNWSWDAKYETPSLLATGSTLKLYLNALLATPTLSDPKWTKSGKVGMKYESKQKPDPISLNKAEASFELMDKAGTTVSSMMLVGGVSFATDQSLVLKYTRLMIGATKGSANLAYNLPLGSSVVASLEGQYDTTEKTTQYGMPNSGASFDGTPLPQPSAVEATDYLSGTLKFQFNLGAFSPYVGFGVSKATSGVESLNSDASRFFALAGLNFNKAE